MPETFLRGEEALALHEGAFDLAVVDGRVDGAADVHLDVRPQACPVPGQGVDLDFRGRDALREVVEHLPCVRPPDVADVGRFVEAVGAEVDAVEVGRVGEFLERGVLAEFLAVGGQAGVELAAGVGDRVAVEVAGGGGGGGGGVGHGVGCGFGDEDVGEGDTEGLGRDLGHLCV